MRTLRKNEQLLKYALQIEEMPEFETDDDGNIKYDGYTDEDGNFFPYLDENGNKIAHTTGKYEVVYGEPVDFMASISMSGGEAEAVEYGLSTESYSAIVITGKNVVPLKEGALIWNTSEPKLKHIDVKIGDISLNGDYAVKTSADFIVMKKSPSLNFDKYILTAVNK